VFQCVSGNPDHRLACASYTSGDAIRVMGRVAKDILPADYQIAWTGSSYQEVTNADEGNTAMILRH